MSDRETRIRAFLQEAGWGDASRSPLAGDASTRRYERLHGPRGRAVLMDAPPGPDGPPLTSLDGKPVAYSAIARLAEDCRPFVAIGNGLRAAGLSAPEIFAHDIPSGLLLLEDLGDAGYSAAIDAGQGPSGEPLDELYRASVDALLELHEKGAPGPLPLPDGSFYPVPPYDRAAMAIETELLIDWFLPEQRGMATEDAVRADYRSLWRSLFDHADADGRVLSIRDYHSPNLIWLGGRQGAQRVGIIDYQDALIGARAYDMVSLLQDARRTVPPAREEAMLDHYIARAGRDPSFDEAKFLAAYAVLGAQRNAKILGIFVRLWRRDGKPAYLAHMPRVADYFERDLAHPALADLRGFLDGLTGPAGRRAAVGTLP